MNTEIIAKSVKIEEVGNIKRCTEGNSSKFYCLEVKIYFDNGVVKNYLLKAHNEPKTLEKFIKNEKNYKDKFINKFGLTKDGQIVFIHND